MSRVLSFGFAFATLVFAVALIGSRGAEPVYMAPPVVGTA